MTHLLNLLAAIALLVWGTHLVRTGILRVLGASLRNVLAKSVTNRLPAAMSGLGVTALVQSSTATALIVSAFVGQGLMSLPSALAVMLGADIGTSLMAVAFSRDLSWLSPLFIFIGVVLFITRQSTTIGRVGRVLIGLGLMLLALSLVTQSANVLTQSAAVKALLASLSSDLLLEIFAGAPLIGLWLHHVTKVMGDAATLVVLFHLTFNVVVGVLFIGVTQWVAHWVEKLLPRSEKGTVAGRQRHLDPTALSTPSLAISCAVREAMHQADVVETMLLGALNVIKHNDRKLGQELRNMDDTVDELYSDIKYYLTKISREALGENEARRWTDIISFTINMEQIGDIVERVIQDIEDKKINPGREFSDAGMAEICDLHARLVVNLRLGRSVFLNGDVRDAQKLLEEKTRFRDLEREYASTHLGRLSLNTVQSIETSSLHLDLISDLKRINSHICAIAYPILDSAGALAPNRLRQSVLDKHLV